MSHPNLEMFDDLHRVAAQILSRTGPYLLSERGRALLEVAALIDGDDLLSDAARLGRAADYAILFGMRAQGGRVLPSKN